MPAHPWLPGRVNKKNYIFFHGNKIYMNFELFSQQICIEEVPENLINRVSYDESAKCVFFFGIHE